MGSDPAAKGCLGYCEVALPVPLDRAFTYAVPSGLRGRVRPGCRVLVAFGARTLAGVVVDTPSDEPGLDVRPVLKLLDDEPALGPDLIALGRWMGSYYCAPLGEVLKAMLPLEGETRTKRVVSLTAEGAAAADGLLAGAVTTEAAVLLALKRRRLTLSYLASKHRGAGEAVRRLRQRGLVAVEESVEQRDPTRARDARLMVAPGTAAEAPAKPGPGERWLLEHLRRDPGPHDVRALALERRDAASIARRLARVRAVRLTVQPPPSTVDRPGARLRLNEDQQAAVAALADSVRKGRFETFLLQGVTGSGKTEVYLRTVEAALERGRSALLLVPEIGLTPALAAQFFERFGDWVAVLHSAFSAAQRSGQWRRIRSGGARVVLGTRSGVFAPVRDLGVVIVDEEHDSSYKQDGSPRYHGRDVAIVRAQAAGATVVLGSATPALESRWNAENGKYRLLRLPQRILARPLPAVEMVDMRREFAETGWSRLFSRQLTEAVAETLAKGEQAMVLLNRRGFAVYLLCRSCGARAECLNCSVTLTYHKREERLLCHYCDHAEPVPQRCAACGGEYLHLQGSGSEKVQEELGAAFPEARIARLDRDTVQGRESYATILRSFREGACNLLVGTQMIAKGHDIPNVTLVCVVDADVGLGRADFRAAERTFQLLTQVAGRAGRGDKPGRVLLQTRNPGHYAIELAAQQDYEAFYARELRFRKSLWYPPLTAMASIVVRSRSLSEALEWSAALGRHLLPPPPGLRLIGPAAAPMVRLRTEYRYQFLLKASRRGRGVIAETLGKARCFANSREWPATALVIDVDPVNFA